MIVARMKSLITSIILVTRVKEEQWLLSYCWNDCVAAALAVAAAASLETAAVVAVDRCLSGQHLPQSQRDIL